MTIFLDDSQLINKTLILLNIQNHLNVTQDLQTHRITYNPCPKCNSPTSKNAERMQMIKNRWIVVVEWAAANKNCKNTLLCFLIEIQNLNHFVNLTHILKSFQLQP